jgi:hypothetical protein
MIEPMITTAPEPKARDAASEAAPQAQAISPVPETRLGNWLVRNPRFTREPLSYTGYQFTRSALAAIPYGIGMALIHHLMGILSVKGSGIGLTEAGRQEFSKGFNTGGYA